MDRAQLTRKQQEFFDFIVDYKEEHNVWPTYREIADAFGYKSPNSVTQNIQSLLKKGYLVKTEEDGYELAPDVKNEYSEEINAGIPVQGIIAAGGLQEAVEADLGTIGLETLFPKIDQMFALRVAGESMKNAGIQDGDFVLLMDSDVKNGDIGAVLYDGQTSLKRIYHDEEGLRLEPANEKYENIEVKPDVFEEVRVLGKYVGHVNKNGIHKKF
jgi:SOS regulatory protein LexA